ncbi:MAG: glycosyltransferase family 2 protein [Tissierellia bacterium]|nr:glycosyltransferase family 2 protein [Tissierellia bacterium]
MIKILLILAITLASVMTLYSLYYVYVAMYFFKVKKDYPETNNFNKFAILVAARNEEQVIAKLVGSLLEQNYPTDKFDVIVMPNNCTDDTKGAAQRAGAIIFEPPLPVKSKGEVLHQTFDFLLKEKDYDAYIIFDADNIADKNFIREMNKALEEGYGAATSLRDSKNPYNSYMSSSYTLFYLIFNVFYNGARSALGMNSLITGTGFMVSKKYLQDLGGWNTRTITEDVEFTLQLSNLGKSIAYVPKAITYDEQPEDNIQAWHQRLRWSIGSQQNFKLMGPKLFDSFKKSRGKNVFDMYIMLLATYMQIFGFVVGIFGLLVLFFANFKAFLFWTIFSILGLFLIQAILSIVSLKFLEKPIKPMMKGILTIWWFTLSWIPIHIIALFKDDIEWKEIEHKSQ